MKKKYDASVNKYIPNYKMILKEKSIKILEVLAIFKFLSTSQIITLNIAKHKPNLVRPIKDLIFYNLIGKLTFGVDPKI
ncbi:MAG: hypothetical protein U9Q66_03145 [Patescibacteria group bacterium]|nr:hypothetical protein [Patescibacteria group bacterium]